MGGAEARHGEGSLGVTLHNHDHTAATSWAELSLTDSLSTAAAAADAGQVRVP